MSVAVVFGLVVTGLVFFGCGLLVGLYLRRETRHRAALEARQSADAELANVRALVKSREELNADLRRQVGLLQERAAADQQRVETMLGELARAGSGAEQLAELKASLSAEAETVTRQEHELRAAAVRAAQAEAAFATAGQKVAELERVLERSVERADALAVERQQLFEHRARLESQLFSERQAAAARAADAEKVRAEVQAAAARLVDEKGQQLLERNQQGLETLLSPVREQLKEFGAAVAKTYDADNRDRAALLQSLKQMQEMEVKLHRDAESLAKALKGEGRVQGNWGEVVLERLFETAGFTEGREYELQVDQLDEDGRRKRPDAFVHLPGNRTIVVDAKCSLTAFLEAAEQEGEARELALQAHVASVRAHVRELANKNYQDLLGPRKLDFVLMFVPSDAAFHAAVATADGLYADAARQGVTLCSPSTLLAMLHVIRHVWRSENQNINAQKIAEHAGKMVDKLMSFVEDLDEVGSRLTQAQLVFNDARGKLSTGRGNLLDKAKALVNLGARAKPGAVQELLLLDAGSSSDEDESPPSPPALPGNSIS